MDILETIGRVAIVYAACMVLLRISGRREMSELGPMDLLTMLLLSETVSPALTGGDNSVPTGLVAATTLMVLCVVTAQISYRSRRAERAIQGEALVLIRDGDVDAHVMRKFMITDEDLRAALHKSGLLRVDEVKRAYVEADGEITIIKAS
ncbi:MAG: DUF421 domain-containing protein [Kofleriaceae bacterium]